MSRATQEDTRGAVKPSRIGAWWPALKYPQYRGYWLFSISALSGQQVLLIAQSWLIYELTGSAVYLALSGLATAIPGIAFSLFGGVMADRIDVRRLLSATQAFMAALATILMVLTLTDV